MDMILEIDLLSVFLVALCIIFSMLVGGHLVCLRIPIPL